MTGPKNSLEGLGKQEAVRGLLQYICIHGIRNYSHFQCTECRYVDTWAPDIGHISQDLGLNHVVSWCVPGALLGVRHSVVSQTWHQPLGHTLVGGGGGDTNCEQCYKVKESHATKVNNRREINLFRKGH